MDKLLKAVKDLKINGTKTDERRFNEFKKKIFKEVKDEEERALSLLNDLRDHHNPTLKHNLMVAWDTVYIAKRLKLSRTKIDSLRVAALLHDIGKLDIHNAILTLGDYAERRAIWMRAHRGQPIPSGPLVKEISVRDIINFKAKYADDPKEYKRLFFEWIEHRKLSDFLDRSLRDYLDHHQAATRRLLEEVGLKKEIIDLAASHHPSYFSDAETEKLPKECRIIEIADKFNAIIQSEGERNYISKKSRTEALDILVHEIRNELASGLFKSFERKALRVLVKKHLPDEVNNELIPYTEKLIKHLGESTGIFHHISDEEEFAKAERAIALISVTLALCKEFSDLIDVDIVHALEKYNEELQNFFLTK